MIRSSYSWALFFSVTILSASVIACGDDETAATQGGGGTGNTVSTGGSGGSGATGGTSSTGGSGGATGGAGGGSGTQDITVTFAAKVNGTDFACDTTYDNLGTANTSGNLTDFRFYVHDVAVVDGSTSIPVELEQDGVWQFENIALLDFEDKAGSCTNGTTELNVSVRGTVPAGTTYTGITFKLGVPFDLNHDDVAIAPSPLNLSALFWNWQGGHKFFRADFVATGAPDPFNFHLGSTGCDGDPNTGGTTSCARPNVTDVNFADFDADLDVIVADYGTLMANSDLSVNVAGAPGCMSGMTDPECVPVFSNIGVDIATGTMDPTAQVLFSLQP